MNLKHEFNESIVGYNVTDVDTGRTLLLQVAPSYSMQRGAYVAQFACDQNTDAPKRSESEVKDARWYLLDSIDSMDLLDACSAIFMHAGPHLERAVGEGAAGRITRNAIIEKAKEFGWQPE